MASKETPNFQEMSIEQLDEWNANIKNQVSDLNEQRTLVAKLRNEKVSDGRIEEAKKQLQILADKNGRTLEEEAEWWIGRLTNGGGTSPDPGRWIQANLVLGKAWNEGLPQ